MALHFQRNAILLGMTGSGKSSLGNSIIGSDVFQVSGGFNAGTQQCQQEENRKISVTDTPGLFDTQHFTAKTSLKVASALTICPNPHAFVIVFNGENRFTHECLRTIDILRVTFTEVCFSHAICVFTRVQEAMSDTEFERLCDENESVRNFIHLCSGRVARIDNRSNERYIRVGQIIRLIDNLSNNGNTTFDSYLNTSIITVLQQQQAINEQQRNRNPHYQPSRFEVIIQELQNIGNAFIETCSDSCEESSLPNWAQIVLGVICVVVGSALGVNLIIHGNIGTGFVVIVLGVSAVTRLPFVRTKIKEMLACLGSHASLLRVVVKL